MFNADEIQITKLLAFGTDNPSPDDYNEHIRPNTATPASISYSMSDYMTTGGGRFAYPSLFGAVEKFFNATNIADGTYTFTQLSSILGLSDRDLTINISQYGTGIGSDDHSERSYIFGNTPFRIKSSMIFEVIDGNKRINNLEVFAEPDNFDFESRPGSYSQYINDFLLEPTFDPYELERGEVTINYSGAGRVYSVYDQTLFTIDQGLESDVNGSLLRGITSLIFNDGFSYFSNIASDTFLSYERGDLKVIYGSPDADNLNEFDAELSLDIYFGYLIAGGDGNDTITGGIFADELQGGEGNDSLDGGLGDDTFIGGAGNDQIEGGSFLFGLLEGTDTSVYEGAFTDYELEFLPDDSIRITDSVGDRDGSDILEGVDFGQFSDKTINLAPGQDIAFVIDTTGSMFDDIDAVKARSNDIIDTIFEGDRGFIDSRIAVVGYNDPGTNTFLSFTDQPKIEDRKTAAQNAINSITVGGGGDFPEAVNAGLIRALSGQAGEWREEAAARRILLFGDAPPKDTDLRAQVLRLAADVGVDVPPAPTIPSSLSIVEDIEATNLTQDSAITNFEVNASSAPNATAPLSIAGDIETTNLTQDLAVTSFDIATINATGTTITIPVEIFTVVIGNDPTTRADFESLAEATGGRSFSATDASEVVDALIEAIETPVDESTDLAIDKISQEEQALIGQNFTYEIQITNNGPRESDGWEVIDTLPEGMSFISSTNGDITAVDNLDGTVTFSSDTNIPIDDVRTFDVQVFVDTNVLPGITLFNQVEVIGQNPDPNLDNNQDIEATPIIAEADLSIDKINKEEKAFTGQNFTYEIQITNNGPGESEGWEVTDTLPEGMSFVSSTNGDITAVDNLDGTVTFSSDTNIAVDDTRTFNVNVFVDSHVVPGITLFNQVDIVGQNPDPNPDNNQDIEETPTLTGVLNPNGGLDINTSNFVDKKGSPIGLNLSIEERFQNNVVYTSDASDILETGDSDDIVNAGDGDNFIDGGAGNDIISAGDGDDDIRGGKGADVLIGGHGLDNFIIVGDPNEGAFGSDSDLEFDNQGKVIVDNIVDFNDHEDVLILQNLGVNGLGSISYHNDSGNVTLTDVVNGEVTSNNVIAKLQPGLDITVTSQGDGNWTLS